MLLLLLISTGNVYCTSIIRQNNCHYVPRLRVTMVQSVNARQEIGSLSYYDRLPLPLTLPLHYYCCCYVLYVTPKLPRVMCMKRSSLTPTFDSQFPNDAIFQPKDHAATCLQAWGYAAILLRDIHATKRSHTTKKKTCSSQSWPFVLARPVERVGSGRVGSGQFGSVRFGEGVGEALQSIYLQ